MRNKLEHILLFLLVVVLIGQIGFWYLTIFHQRVPLTFPDGGNVEVWVEGENIRFEVDYCRTTDKPAMVTRVFTDGVMYLMPSVIVPAPPVGCGRLTRTFKIPSTLSAGEYTMQSHVEIQVNPFAHRTATWSSPPFTIE